jgi:hypothetical protein
MRPYARDQQRIYIHNPSTIHPSSLSANPSAELPRTKVAEAHAGLPRSLVVNPSPNLACIAELYE